MKSWKDILKEQRTPLIAASILFVTGIFVQTLSNAAGVSINDAADIITATVTLVGIYIAWSGLNTWKKQVRGTKEFDIAYKLNYSVLRLREAIKSVRNPAIWPSENREALKFAQEKYPELSIVEVKKKPNEFIYERRWQEISKTLAKVEANLLAAEVLWGREIIQLIQPIKRKITDLNIALSQHFNPDLKTKSYEEIDETINADLSEPPKDRFSIELNNAVQKVTDYLKPKIRS